MRRLRRFWGFLLFSVLLAPGASAAPCVPGTLQSYIALGGTGCDLGVLDVAGFAIVPGQSFATPIDPALVQVAPGGTPQSPTLILTLGSNAGAGQLLESIFRFSVSASFDLTGVGVALGAASASGDGAVTAVLDVCAGGSFFPTLPLGCTGSEAATAIAFAIADEAGLAELATVAGAGFFDVFADITIDGGLAGSSSLGSATLSFVPEPSTALLVVLGLAFFAVRRHR
jgi:hypothetical protein